MIFGTKKSPDLRSGDFFQLRSELFVHGADAVGADVLALVVDDVLRVVAEDAGRLILAQDDGLTIHEDLDAVLLLDTERSSQLDGKHDTAELVNFSNNTGRFHKSVLQYVWDKGKDDSKIIHFNNCIIPKVVKMSTDSTNVHS